MLDERLFFFIHGMATMFFIVTGLVRFRKKGASRLAKLCGYLLLYWGFLEVKDLAFYLSAYVRHDYVANILVLVDMTAVTAASLFLIELVNTGWCTLRHTTILAIPFLVAVVLYAIFAAHFIIDITFICAILYSLGIIIYMTRAIRHYNKLIIDNYSNTDSVHLHWLKQVIVLLTICLILWTLSYYHSSWTIDACYQISLIMIWCTILYYSDKQQPVQITPIAENPIAAPSSDHGLAQSLEQALVVDKVWKNPHLTLIDLAKMVGTNRTYLSNYLNNTLNTTFYDYINNFRLQAALEQIHDATSTATMLEIAESSGFNSLSTFRRAFVRAKRCSFGEYRQKIDSEIRQ